MSLLMQGRRTSTTKRIKEGSEITTRDMSLKKCVIAKVNEHSSDGKAEVTAVWNVEVQGNQTRISFSRDNLGVWVNGRSVTTSAYISDRGYDVDLFFDVPNCKGHIYSDVEGNEMMNYLVMGSDLLGFDHQNYNHLAKK